MTILEIIKKYLKENKYDGLFWRDEECCSCRLDDLIPCGTINEDCMAGRLQKCAAKNSDDCEHYSECEKIECMGPA